MLKNGIYKIFFKSMDEHGTTKRKDELASYMVKDGFITQVSGKDLQDEIKKGPLTPMLCYRLMHSYNNGYFITEKVA